MTSGKKDTVLYWVFTAPLVLLMLVSAFGYLSASPLMVEGMAHLGYPLYLLKIIGTAKVLGVIAIVYGRLTTLKEWAYAGFVINFIGATASHLFSGDDFGASVMPMVFLAFLLGSYFYWKKSSSKVLRTING